MVKILNLNLWNYNHFGDRKPKILNFIRKNNPEIVAFQEVRDDTGFNKKGDNQAKQLNKELKFPYYAFYPTTNKQKERPEKYKNYCIEGTAVLSKYPILKFEGIKLKKQKEDRYNCGNLYVKIKAKKIIDLIVVHFSNSDLFSLLHLIETLKWVSGKKIKPIILGDFNMRHSEWLHDLIEGDYTSSLKYKKYLSYPPDKWTLDYILIPKKFKFKSFECSEEELSDHRALIAEISL